MKKICIMLPSVLPVPAILGGAVETLVENLIIQNEYHPTYKFVVLSPYNKQAQLESKKFKYTQFVYFKINMKAEKIYNKFIFRPLKKLFKISLPDNPMRYRMAKYIAKNNNFDWILFEGGEIFGLAYLQKFLPKEKLLIHSHWAAESATKLENTYAYYLAISNYVGKVWEDKSGRNVESCKIFKNCISIENFSKKIDEEEKQKLRKSLGIDSDKFVVIFTGRIIQEKGIKELIQALLLIENPNILLLVIGSANFGVKTSTKYEKEVSALIKNIKDKIIFTGFVKNEELYKYYNISDISVIPSIWEEPAGLVLIEAMAAGKPIITTGSGGMSEYTNDECAIFVERDNNLVESLATKISYLYENSDIRKKMSDAAIKKAEEFSCENYLKNFNLIIEEISN